MATTGNLGKLATIDDFISSSDSIKMKYSELSLNDMFGPDKNIEFPIFNVYDDYIDELKSLAKTVELTDEEYNRYYQAPKLLANDKYKNSELDFIIMRLNGIYDPKDFTLRTLLLLKPSDLNLCLSKMLISNRSFIETYNQNNPYT